MILVDKSKSQIMDFVRHIHPEIDGVLERVEGRVPFIKRQIEEYQGAVLYALANKFGSSFILEIGTAWGYSAAIMAEACPKAQIVTLNPKQAEVERAVKHLRPYRNVTVLQRKSWDFYDEYAGPDFDFVFVDGDHGRVWCDVQWYDRLNIGGLMLFHDYSPVDSRRPTPPVFHLVNWLADNLGRDVDVLIVDDTKVGMAGFIKLDGERAPEAHDDLEWYVDFDDRKKWKRVSD